MTYPVISLFSGAGFLDFGFAENGFDIIWGAELIPEFAQANNYNINLRYGYEERVEVADITQVKNEDIPSAVGVIGGPPCQDFSIGNASSPGVNGERGKLVWDFLSKINYHRPDFFLFENVEALYKIKKHRNEALFPLLNQLEDLGYDTSYKILNALEYGIPQDRSRVFIVGFKNTITRTLRAHDLDGFTWPKKIFENAKTLYDWPDSWDFGTEIDERLYIETLGLPYDLTVHSVIGNEDECGVVIIVSKTIPRR